MQHRNPVAGKVRDIESKDAPNAVHQHHGDKAYIKTSKARLPLIWRVVTSRFQCWVDARIVRQQLKGEFNPIDRRRRGADAEPEFAWQ